MLQNVTTLAGVERTNCFCSCVNNAQFQTNKSLMARYIIFFLASFHYFTLAHRFWINWISRSDCKFRLLKEWLRKLRCNGGKLLGSRMKVVKGEPKSQKWIWFKPFEKRLFRTFLKVQDLWITWRAYLRFADFWDLSWLWTSFLLKVCSFRIMFAVGQGAQKKLMSWVSNRVPKQFVAEGFPTCFKDGILLCILAEKVAPGACPRFDLLDPDQPLRNLKLALNLVEKHIQIKPPITANEIFEGGVFAEKRLLLLIAQIKMASEKFALPPPSPEQSDDTMRQNTLVTNKCLAKGMGLLVAVRGERARLSIFIESIENLDMIIEIRGPNNTACSKRITSAMSLSRNHFVDVKNVQDAQIEEEILKKRIPFEYTILGQKISVSYTPLESGKHTMSIIWQGQHIVGSPYTISVDDSTEFPEIWDKPSTRIHNQPRNQNKQCFDKSCEKKGLVASSGTGGRIIKKRVLRYIVKVEGNDVVIDGKEDLCDAINRVKKQLRKVSKEEETETDGNDSKCALENNFSERRNKTDILSNSDNVLSYTTSDSVVRGNMPKDSHVLEKENNSLNQASVAKNNNEQYRNSKFDVDIAYKADDNCSRIESPDDKLKAIRITNDIVNIINETEARTKKKDVLELNNNLSDERDVKIHLYQRHNDFSDSDINSNNGTEARRNSATDDVSFYPVHKVEYELLHDDEEEPEEQCDYNPKRRISYTELFESNYLDGDIEMVDVIKMTEEESFCPGVKNNEDNEELISSENYRKELEEHGPGDIRNCLRANHDLFQCDHSLGFWSETVTETPPEFISSESNKVDDDSESHDDNPSENNRFENPEPSEYEEVTLEFDKSATTKKASLENEDEIHFVKSVTGDNPSENNRFEKPEPSEYEEVALEFDKSATTKKASLENEDEIHFGKSETGSEEYVPYDPISFSFKNTDLNKIEDNDLELIRNSLLKELPDNKKRPSWPDRDLLPAIRESSIEDFIDLETCENEVRTKEYKDSDSTFVTASGTENKLNDCDYLSPSSSKTSVKVNEGESSQMFCEMNVSSSSSNTHVSVINLAKEYENNISRESFSDTSQKIEDTNRYAFSSMNILSASPYKIRSKDSEIKFSRVTYVERPRSQSLSELDAFTSTNTSIKTASSCQLLSNGFILTHAVPAVVHEHQNVTSENKSGSSDEVISDEIHQNTYLDLNAYDLKSTKPPSVKKVIEIFQKEKEEPLDTWPTESRVKSSRQKLDDDMFLRKSPERSESPDQKNCLLSCMEASRSTIKDRVKVFESDEKKNPAITSKKSVQKCAISTISDKKKYWENFMS